jgi:hypothetical protein
MLNADLKQAITKLARARSKLQQPPVICEVCSGNPRVSGNTLSMSPSDMQLDSSALIPDQ